MHRPSTFALVVAVTEDALPVQWAGRQAIVTLPEHVDASNVDQIRERLLELVNRGAGVLIADLTGTISCDYGGADALMRAYQRAHLNGTQLRLVSAGDGVRRVLAATGLDRLVSIYPDLEAAVAASTAHVVVPFVRKPDSEAGDRRARRRRQDTGPVAWPGSAGVTPAVLWSLIDALEDGVALVGDDGVLALANRRLEEIFGYERGELAGCTIESLMPSDLRAAHVHLRAGYAQQRQARPMATRPRLIGLRKDGATVPVEISLTPVPTRTGQFTLAVVRDMTRASERQDLVELAQATASARHDHRNGELLDRVVRGLFGVGQSLQAATDLPHEQAIDQIKGALHHLDETIREIRDHVFTARGQQFRADQTASGKRDGRAPGTDER